MAVQESDMSAMNHKISEAHAVSEASKDDSSTSEAKKNSAVVFYQLGDYLESMKKLHDTDEKLEELESKAKKDSPSGLGAKNSSSKKSMKSKAPQEPIFTEDDSDTPPKLDGLTFAILSGPGVQITMNGLLTAIGQMSQYMSKLTADVTQRNSDWIKNYYEYGNITGVGEMNTRAKELKIDVSSVQDPRTGMSVPYVNIPGVGSFKLTPDQVKDPNKFASAVNSFVKSKTGTDPKYGLPGDNPDALVSTMTGIQDILTKGSGTITLAYTDGTKELAPGGIDQLQKQYPADASDTTDGNGMTSGTAVSEFMKIASTIQQITQSTSTTLNSDNSVPTTSMQTVTQAISTGTSDLTTLLQALAGINSSNNTLLNK